MNKFSIIDEAELVGHKVEELPDTPQMDVTSLKRKFDELSTDVIIPAFNNLVAEANNIDEEMLEDSDNYVSNRVIKEYVDDKTDNSRIEAVAEAVEEANEYTDGNIAEAKEYTDNGLALKVDKAEGKGLSTNDYTTEEKTKLAELTKITVDKVLSNTSENPIANKAVKTEMDNMKANFQDGCSMLAGAITTKGVPTPSDATPAEMAANILKIEGGGGGGGTDVSDTTATADDVINTKYFYDKNGVKTKGRIVNKGQATFYSYVGTDITPIPEGYYEEGWITPIQPKSKNVTPLAYPQHIEFPGEVYTSIDVEAISYNVQTPLPSEILENKSVDLSVGGQTVSHVVGTMTKRGELLVTPTDVEQTFESGYYSRIKVNAVDPTPTPSGGKEIVCAFQGDLGTYANTWRLPNNEATTSFYNNDCCTRSGNGSFVVTKAGTLEVVYSANPYNSGTTSNYQSKCYIQKNETNVGNMITGTGAIATAKETIPVVAGDEIRVWCSGRGGITMTAYFAN